MAIEQDNRGRAQKQSFSEERVEITSTLNSNSRSYGLMGQHKVTMNLGFGRLRTGKDGILDNKLFQLIIWQEGWTFRYLAHEIKLPGTMN